MTRYFFDTRDDDDFVEDDLGLELPDLEQVKVVAAKALADMSREVLPGSMRRNLTVEVRELKGPVLRATLVFEATELVGQ